MNPDLSAALPDRLREISPARWIVAIAALLVLALVSWRGYAWLQSYVAQRHAAAEGQTLSIEAPADSGASAPTAVVTARPADEPLAPAVTGEAVRRCVRPDGQLVLTNQACPKDSTPEPAATNAPTPAAPALMSDDPSLRVATCHFVAAEIERLTYAFAQPLPPPVLDLISTRLGALRREAQQGHCQPTAGAHEGAEKPTRRQAQRRAASEKGAH